MNIWKSVVALSLLVPAVSQAGTPAQFIGALASLNSAGNTRNTRELVIAVVSQQTQLPPKTLRAQQASTRLGYGDLLAANLLAIGSGKNLQEIVALKTGTKTWDQLAVQLRVNLAAVTAKAVSADQRVKSSARMSTGPQPTRDDQIWRDAGFKPGDLNPRGPGM
jgi:hypothetical protein